MSVDTAKTCATCRHWKCGERERAYYGHKAEGTCALGGPKPDGCSDTRAGETCDKWTEDKR